MTDKTGKAIKDALASIQQAIQQQVPGGQGGGVSISVETDPEALTTLSQSVVYFLAPGTWTAFSPAVTVPAGKFGIAKYGTAWTVTVLGGVELASAIAAMTAADELTGDEALPMGSGESVTVQQLAEFAEGVVGGNAAHVSGETADQAKLASVGKVEEMISEIDSGNITLDAAINPENPSTEKAPSSKAVADYVEDAAEIAGSYTPTAIEYYSGANDVYDRLIAKYDQLVTDYPHYVSQKRIIGHSTKTRTVGVNTDASGYVNIYEYVLTTKDYNRDINNTTIGAPAPVINKPIIMFNAGIHGTETSAVYALYNFIRDVCIGVRGTEFLRENFEIHIIPVVSPHSFIAKTSDITGLDASIYGASSINPNRNFDANFYAGSSRGGEGNLSNQLSEVIAMQNWYKDMSKRNVALCFDLHNNTYNGNDRLYVEIGCAEKVGQTYDTPEHESLIPQGTIHGARELKREFLAACAKAVPWLKQSGNYIDSEVPRIGYAFGYLIDHTGYGGSSNIYRARVGLLGCTLEFTNIKTNGVIDKVKTTTVATHLLGDIVPALLENYSLTHQPYYELSVNGSTFTPMINTISGMNNHTVLILNETFETTNVQVSIGGSEVVGTDQRVKIETIDGHKVVTLNNIDGDIEITTDTTYVDFSNGSKYINCGNVIDTANEYVIEITYSTNLATRNLLGVINTNNGNAGIYLKPQDATIGTIIRYGSKLDNGGDVRYFDKSLSDGEIHTVKFGVNGYEVDGVSYAYGDGEVHTLEGLTLGDLFLGRLNGSTSGSYFQGRIYNFKVWEVDGDTETLIMNLVPTTATGHDFEDAAAADVTYYDLTSI